MVRLAYEAYRLLALLLTPAILALFFLRLSQGKEDPNRWRERWGEKYPPRPGGALVWLHAASVGEFVSALPLIKALNGQGRKVLVTSGTLTSSRIASKRLPAGVLHCFAPLDHPLAVTSFFNHWKPRMGILLESELWPCLLGGAKARALPILLVNARLSERSFKRWHGIRPVASAMLAAISEILAQTPEDAQRFEKLGAKAVTLAGNLKFDADPLPVELSRLKTLQERIGARPRWLAASTHPGEEELLAQAHRAISRDHPELLTLVVPRHPERGPEIAKTLAAKGLRVGLQSRGDQPDSDCTFFIADALGELGLWYSLSPIAFLGGSLVPKGGQNLLEAIRFGCALISGPHCFNFAAIAKSLKEAQALAEVKDVLALEKEVKSLLSHRDHLRQRQSNAQLWAEQQQGALPTILEAIEEVWPAPIPEGHHAGDQKG